MQTFLPCPGFTDSARVLDVKRLGKQRVETKQVLRALTVRGYGWRHHPAAAMWAGYEEALVRYGLEVCAVWCDLGRSDTCGHPGHRPRSGYRADGDPDPRRTGAGLRAATLAR